MECHSLVHPFTGSGPAAGVLKWWQSCGGGGDHSLCPCEPVSEAVLATSYWSTDSLFLQPLCNRYRTFGPLAIFSGTEKTRCSHENRWCFSSKQFIDLYSQNPGICLGKGPGIEVREEWRLIMLMMPSSQNFPMLWTKLCAPPPCPRPHRPPLQRPLKCLCWSPNPQCDYIWRQGFQKAMKVHWGHKSGALTDRITVLIRSTTRKLTTTLLPHSNSSQVRKKVATLARNKILTKPWISWHLDLGLPTLQNCEETISVI